MSNSVIEIDLEKYLKSYFGYNEFRHSQKEIVEALMASKDVVAILPTGAGKSICYQLPALLMPGIAVVISPLISLMQDQVIGLAKNGLPAVFLNSSLRSGEIAEVLANLNRYKLLYIAPERFSDPKFIQILQNTQVSLFAIDEAHCISHWGHAFRPEYRQLALLKQSFPKTPVIALTATATQEVEKDMIAQLTMQAPYIVRASFDRPNLILQAEQRSVPLNQLLKYLEKRKEVSGIIYAATRKTVDETHDFLRNKNYNVGKYHAGMPKDERNRAQHDFVYGHYKLMVATVAFGMGIHKPDIRFVVHMDMPQSIEQYYQEIGRAGRDGLPSECFMLYSTKELVLFDIFNENITDEQLRRSLKKKANQMYSLSSTFKCRRKELLRYFGEHYSKINCQSCDNCLEDTEIVDETIPAQMVLSCVYRLQERFGITHVIDVLRGSKNVSVLNKGHDKLSTYGLMPERSEADVRYLILSLLDLGYLQRSEGEYPVLKWTEKSREVTQKKEKVLIRRKIEVERTPIFKASKNYDKALFETLSTWRDAYAVKTNVPPYVVMGEQLLIEIAAKYPLSREKFLQLNGFGPIQWDKYGSELLELLKNYSGSMAVQAKPKRQESSLETARLFQEGISVAQIANRRQITVATVLAHLCEQIAAGAKLDITPIVSKEKQEAINQALKSLGTEKLKPIKEALPEDYTYDEIRLVAAFKRL